MKPGQQPRVTLLGGTTILLPHSGKCELYGCNEKPTYGENNEVFTCIRHKEDHYKKLIPNKLRAAPKSTCVCMWPGCTTIMSYGTRRCNKKFCHEHNGGKGKECREEGCTVGASYGPGGKKYFCVTHKKDGDITYRERTKERLQHEDVIVIDN